MARSAWALPRLSGRRVARRRLEALVVVLWLSCPIVADVVRHVEAVSLRVSVSAAAGARGRLCDGPAVCTGTGAVDRGMRPGHAYAGRHFPRASRLGKRWPVRAVLLAVIAASLAAVASLAVGPIRIELGDNRVFRSTSIFRPVMVALLFALPLGLGRKARRYVLPLVIASVLPLPAYRDVARRAHDGRASLSFGMNAWPGLTPVGRARLAACMSRGPTSGRGIP